jgi:hypothetical protein
VTQNSTPKKARFLKAYAITCQINKAAEMAGIDRGTHYDWLKDPEYKAQFEAARVQAADMLEEEAVRRAFDGSDVLLIFLLKAARPDKYRENRSIQVSGPGGGAVTHKFILEPVSVPGQSEQ